MLASQTIYLSFFANHASVVQNYEYKESLRDTKVVYSLILQRSKVHKGVTRNYIYLHLGLILRGLFAFRHV